jgi:hypothetical protein
MIKQSNSLLGITILIVLLTSCAPLICFESAQPKGIGPEKEFSEEIQGKYLSVNISHTEGTETDSCWLNIYKTMAVLYENNSTLLTMSLNDFNQQIKDTSKRIDTLNCKVVFRSDSVFIEYSKEKEDTVFMISDVNVLKKWQGKFYLNVKADNESQWILYQLDLNYNTLWVNTVNDTTDLAWLKQHSSYRIIKDAPDTTGKENIKCYVFNPTKNEFKDFIVLGGLRNRQKFTRLSNIGVKIESHSKKSKP